MCDCGPVTGRRQTGVPCLRKWLGWAPVNEYNSIRVQTVISPPRSIFERLAWIKGTPFISHNQIWCTDWSDFYLVLLAYSIQRRCDLYLDPENILKMCIPVRESEKFWHKPDTHVYTCHGHFIESARFYSKYWKGQSEPSLRAYLIFTVGQCFSTSGPQC